jgi:hypothetical protein
LAIFLLGANVIGKSDDCRFGIKWGKGKRKKKEEEFLNLILGKKI